jgi:hypothetical protein
VNLCQPAKVLTSCPACLQGLSRYRDDVGVESDYIVVELASNRLGEKWQTEFLDKVNRGLSFPRAGVGMQSGGAPRPPHQPQPRPPAGAPPTRGWDGRGPAPGPPPPGRWRVPTGFPRWRVGTRTTFRATGKGWQSRMDEVLREYVASQVH